MMDIGGSGRWVSGIQWGIYVCVCAIAPSNYSLMPLFAAHLSQGSRSIDRRRSKCECEHWCKRYDAAITHDPIRRLSVDARNANDDEGSIQSSKQKLLESAEHVRS